MLAFPMEKYDDLPKDIIKYDVILDESIAKTKLYLYEKFDTIPEAFEYLNNNADPLALKEYLKKI
jgi:hypothetical protein